MPTNRKRHLKSEFARFQISSILSNFFFICQIMLAKSWGGGGGLNLKGPYLSLKKEKEKFCVVFTYSIKQAREISNFHVAVVRRRQEM